MEHSQKAHVETVGPFDLHRGDAMRKSLTALAAATTIAVAAVATPTTADAQWRRGGLVGPGARRLRRGRDHRKRICTALLRVSVLRIWLRLWAELRLWLSSQLRRTAALLLRRLL